MTWQELAIGVAAVPAMAVTWVAVQCAWHRAFPRPGCDPDVLVLRGGCGGGCGCVPRSVHGEEDMEAPLGAERRRHE